MSQPYAPRGWLKEYFQSRPEPPAKKPKKANSPQGRSPLFNCDDVRFTGPEFQFDSLK